jgi:chromosome segregation ATPase
MCVDHWDEITELRAKTDSGDLEEQLSENERTIAEVKAACLIIDARINAYNESLTFLQTKLEGLNERVLQAEKAYAVWLGVAFMDMSHV